MKFNLIIPIAADYNIVDHTIPYIFQPDNSGILFCVKSILGLNLSIFDRIIFVVLNKHNKAYYLEHILQTQFKCLNIPNAEVIVLNKPTKNQPETIFQAIKLANLTGSIFIKDADSYFNGEIFAENSIAIYSLENLHFVDPRNKSYVSIDEMFYITNIIEKRVISHYFSAGGYGFKSAEEYCYYYNKLCHFNDLYISHIIYLMLLDNHIFRPILIDNYNDWGTSELLKFYIKYKNGAD